ncbi:MAG: hypothetical protein AB8H86_10330 [Polyangiales bacterium]
MRLFTLMFLSVASLAQVQAQEFVDQTARSEPQTASPSAHPNPWGARFAVEAQVGMFGPVGGLGAAFEYAPNEYIALSVGAGAAVSGWRAAAGIRAGLPVLPRLALGLEAWYSLGPHRDPLSGFGHRGTTSSWKLSHHGRLGISMEYRSFTGFRVRPTIGAAFLAAESGFRCSATPCDATEPRRRVFPYLGLSIGYAVVPR